MASGSFGMGPKASSGSASAARIRRNWHYLSFLVALNQGCANAPRCFATSLLDADVGYYGSGLLYVLTCVCSLCVSCPAVLTIGQRCSLFVAMLLYSVYVGLFALSTLFPLGSHAQWAIFLPASCIGGVAASFLWTAQGGYFGRSVEALMEAASIGRQSATSQQASIFAVYFLSFEGFFKLLHARAISVHFPPFVIFICNVFVGVVCAFGAFTLQDFSDSDKLLRPAVSRKLLKAMELWSDPVLWCLAPTNLTFGFTAAFLQGYVNAHFTAPQLGQEYPGYFAAAVAFLAALLSQVFGALALRSWGKGPLLLFGSLCFAGIALTLLANLAGWGFWLLVPYALQGCGRAVYESTNRGVFAELFTGEKTEGAFANVMVQATLSFAGTFFFSALLPRSMAAAFVLALAAITQPAYLLAHRLRERSEQQQRSRSNSELGDDPERSHDLCRKTSLDSSGTNNPDNCEIGTAA